MVKAKYTFTQNLIYRVQRMFKQNPGEVFSDTDITAIADIPEDKVETLVRNHIDLKQGKKKHADGWAFIWDKDGDTELVAKKKGWYYHEIDPHKSKPINFLTEKLGNIYKAVENGPKTPQQLAEELSITTNTLSIYVKELNHKLENLEVGKIEYNRGNRNYELWTHLRETVTPQQGR